MDSLRRLLDLPHLAVVTRHGDLELTRIQNIIEHRVLVDGRVELEEAFSRLLLIPTTDPVPKTLDLIGHSTPEALLQLGNWVIDTTKPTVTAFFREIADNDVLLRLGINAVRLLGCCTAETEKARLSLCTLSDILGVQVYGTNNLLYSAHYDAKGFAFERRYMLVCSSDLRDERERADRNTQTGDRYPRTLDVDALPEGPIPIDDAAWPYHLATVEDVRFILSLVRRSEGARMPGLLASPNGEVLMPGSRPGSFRRLQVLLGGEFIRVYPDGPQEPGVVYPVRDSRALHRRLEGFAQILTSPSHSEPRE